MSRPTLNRSILNHPILNHPILKRPILNQLGHRARGAARVGLTVAVLAGVTAGVAVMQDPPAAAVAQAPAVFVLASQNISAAGAPPAGSAAARVAAAERQGVASKDAALAADRAAAARQLEADRRAAAQQAARSATRDPRSAARSMLVDFGWGDGQFQCLDALWMKESGWNYRASNPSSGAFGLAQALPGSKMGSVGPDWQTNPLTQIRWGLGYIRSVYGSPCGAWAHSRATNWY